MGRSRRRGDRSDPGCRKTLHETRNVFWGSLTAVPQPAAQCARQHGSARAHSTKVLHDGPRISESGASTTRSVTLPSAARTSPYGELDGLWSPIRSADTRGTDSYMSSSRSISSPVATHSVHESDNLRDMVGPECERAFLAEVSVAGIQVNPRRVFRNGNLRLGGFGLTADQRSAREPRAR